MIASETDEWARLREGTVKMLTGGETISARRMREDPWCFRPTHKIIVATNHEPEIRGDGSRDPAQTGAYPFPRPVLGR